MNQYKKLNNIIGWGVFAIATAVYFLTIEPTVSWWDPGEHISTAYKLQVGHPPGAPFFGLIGRMFSLLAFGNTAKVAVMINAMLSLSSSFTILFLFWSITMLARKIIVPEGDTTKSQMWSIFAAGFVGSMSFTFSDSFWFSAVEANVFGMSYLCTAIVFWAMLKWEMVADQPHHYRWLVFITFMIGLSIGVHLLNLLTIPALAFIFYFKKYKPSRNGILLTALISFVLLALVMYIIIPWIPQLAGKFELIFVNSFGLPFNSGIIFYFLLMIGLIIWGLIFTRKKGKTILNTVILSFTFLLVGYSAFLTLVIRSNAGTPINEDAPKDAISLVSFLNREQYGTWPFLYGQYYTAPVIDYADGPPIYARDNASGKYVVIDDRTETIPVFDPRFTTIFPRMWCRDEERRGASDFFKSWGGPGVPIETTGPDGKPETVNRPTFGENLKFFMTYQVNWMYLRYLMWNFCGRQNDVQGMGDSRNGNWITGIPFLDKLRLGHTQQNLPERLQNLGRERYFMLPLLLGLIGFFFLLKKDYRKSIIVILLFLMTGMAIVLYLNQKPYEPRERDYSYAGSFYAFSIWIGLGVLGLIDFLKKYKKLKEPFIVGLVAFLTTLLVPGIMAQQNWHNHDRSKKYAARDFACNYLNSCDKNAVLFTNGDNDTFPLWYALEVEGVRRDIRIVNLELSGGSWYIDQLFRKMYDGDPLPFTLDDSQYQPGTNDYIPYYDAGIKGYVELKEFVAFIKSNDPLTYMQIQNGKKVKIFPTKKVYMAVDTAACYKSGIVPPYFRKKMTDTIQWTIKSNHLQKNDLMLLDFLASNNWKRPVYFVSPYSVKNFCDVESYTRLEGWVSKLLPVKNSTDEMGNNEGVDALGTYNILMKLCKFGNLNDPCVYVDPESRNNSIKPKNTFIRTAQSLIIMGEKKKAVELMDLYFNYFPDTKFIPETYDLYLSEMYYLSGEHAKGKKLLERIVKLYTEDLEYYYSYTGKDRDAFQDDIQTSLGIIKQANYIASRYKDKKLADQFNLIYNQESGK
ncbi:MAG: DUF2723 domain-containing protein [Bacteroidetes bacterium]|nr:DUF2723 domain-containing protein [Bacteroidota bacterium]